MMDLTGCFILKQQHLNPAKTNCWYVRFVALTAVILRIRVY